MKGLFNITYTTAGQARREPIYYILTGIFAVLVYASRFLVLFVFEGEDAVLLETGIASISACGFLLALLLSWLLIRQEMERMSVLTVLSKPVSRFSFITGKYAGLLYAIFLSIVFLFLVFCLTLWESSKIRIISTIDAQLYDQYLQTYLNGGVVPSNALVVFGDWFWLGLKLFVVKWVVPGMIGTVPVFVTVAMVLAICSVSSIFFEILPTTGFVIGFLILGSLSGSVYEVLVTGGEPGMLRIGAGWLVHLLIPDLFRLNIASGVGSRLDMGTVELMSYFLPFLGYALVAGILYVGFVLSIGTAFFQRTEIT